MTEADDLSQLTGEQKRALLATLLANDAARQAAPNSLPPIPAHPNRDQLPLSFAQERLWFLHQLDPMSALYNITLALLLEGPLDEELLGRAVREVVRRHEVLRTTFVSDGGIPRLVVGVGADAALEVVDLSHVKGVPDDQAQIEKRLTEEARQPFDLAKGPLLRLNLFRLAPDEHVIHLVMHHIISDAWSIVVFAREAIELYQAFVSGRPSALPEMTVQYADYAHWQRETLTPAVQAAELEYWRTQLAGAEPLDLPTDRPRPPVVSFAGEREMLALPRDRTAELRAFCRRESVTPFVTLLAAFSLVLGRYSGQDDIVIGTPVSNRERAEVEGLIGIFVNTVVIRAVLGGEPTFRELVHRLRRTVLDAYTHQRLPFEKLVEELVPERQLDRTPLFQVLFVAPHGPVHGIRFAGGTASVIDVHSGTAKFDLVLSAVDRGEELAFYLEYKSDVFEAATAQRILGHLDSVLEVVLADPDIAISDVALLRGAERQRILVEWNRHEVDPVADQLVPEAFTGQAQRTPEAIAAVWGGNRISYAEMEARVDRLVKRLLAEGVRPQDTIAVGLPRTVDLLVAALAVWKAGAIYVPVEPSHPAARIGYIVNDADARLVLTDSASAPRFEESGRRLLLVDTLDHDGPLHGDFPQIRADHAAYVMYTSGSTGTPKGVVTEHASFSRYLRWANRKLLEGRADLLPAVSPPSFDMSLKQLFGPLVRGGEVWLVSHEIVLDPHRLLAELRERSDARIGLNCAPFLWHGLVDALDAGAEPPTTLSVLFLGGDHLPPRLLDRTWSHFPHIEICNIYGPTETTANASFGRVLPGEVVTIGRPIDHAEIYLLDDRLEPVPIGVPGRLFIGGDNLARGYLNRPDETSARFIPHPFRANARIYDSGDRGQFLPDGRIQLLDRSDRQVKVRGIRIELGEIEVAVASCPGVRDAHTQVVGDSTDRAIVAYVVPEDGKGDLRGPLRGFLTTRLPGAMIPSSIVEVDSLPRLPSGKVDSARLPAPASARPAREFMAPRNDLERQIVEIWRAALGVDQIGVHDDFFELGGHSLLVLQVQAMLQARLGCDLPVIDFFRYPTPAALSEQLRNLPATAHADDDRAEQVAEGKQRLALLRKTVRETR
jgi:amino acid adenylation domain-containing protein